MESKLTVFAVFVTLGCSSSVLSSTPSFVLSEEQTNGLSELKALRKSALLARYHGLNLLSDVLEKSAVQHIFELVPKSPIDISTPIADALVSMKNGVNHILASILIALSTSCDGIETTRNATHADLDDIVSMGVLALRLAVSGTYFQRKAEFEGYRTRVREDVKHFEGAIFQLIRTCSNTTHVETLAAIETAENGATTGALRSADAAVDAIQMFAIAVATGNRRKSLLPEIAERHHKALSELRDETVYQVAVLEALYVTRCIGQPGIVSILTVDRYTMIMTAYLFTDVSKNILDLIMTKVNDIILGLSAADEATFSRTDAAEAKVAAIFFTVCDLFLESMIFRHPEKSNAVAYYRELSKDLTRRLSAAYFGMINVVQDRGTKNYSEILAEINSCQDKLYYLSATFVRATFTLMRNNQTWSDRIERQFKSVANETIGITYAYVDLIRRAVEIFAKATCDNEAVSIDDIYTLQDTAARGYSAAEDYTGLATRASIISLLASRPQFSSHPVAPFFRNFTIKL